MEIILYKHDGIAADYFIEWMYQGLFNIPIVGRFG